MLGKQGHEHVHAKRNQSSHRFLAKNTFKDKEVVRLLLQTLCQSQQQERA